MLYISHLSFHAERRDDGPWHGYFTCVVDAPEIETALGKTRDLIHRLKDEEDVLEDIDAVFLESCVEVRSVPGDGFMASFQEWDGEVQGSIVTSVRGTTGDHALAFGWVADDEDEETAAEGGGEDLGAEPGEPLDDFDEPFVTF